MKDSAISGDAKEVNPPARSAKERELTNDCLTKLKILLVPSLVPFANPVLENHVPKTFLQIISEPNIAQHWSLSSR